MGAVHMATLTISPVVWQDEVQLVEWGRTMVSDPKTDWSLLFLSKDHSIQTVSYFGCAIQEMAYGLFAPSMMGPRIVSLLCALGCASLAVAWLVARGTRRPIALMCGWAFLLDPFFVASYRGARVDGLALAGCFASCWVLSSLREVVSPSQRHIGLAMAGAMAVAGLFCWPAAIMAFPVILMEGAQLVRAWTRGTRLLSWSLRAITLFAAGGLVVAMAAVLPMWHEIGRMSGDFLQISGSDLKVHESPVSVALAQLASFLQVIVRNPWLLACAVLGAFGKAHRRLMGAALLIPLALMLVTNAYPNRLLYLLPAAIGILAGSVDAWERFEFRFARWRVSLGRVCMVLVLGWGVAMSLVLRQVLALSQRGERDPRVLFSSAQTAIGAGPKRVFLGVYEFYFVGRELGWKMFRPVLRNGPVNARAWSELLGTLEFAILRTAEITPEDELSLKGAGLDRKFVVLEHGVRAQSSISAGLASLGGAKPYGPYTVFARSEPESRTLRSSEARP